MKERMNGSAERKLRVYADTSVIGGCEDDEFREHSWQLIQLCMKNEVLLVVSDLVGDELEPAPFAVRQIFDSIPHESKAVVRITPEAESLADSYIRSGALAESMRRDALHIAVATLVGVDFLVSWNFKHMVNRERIAMYNESNRRLGYRSIEICSPREFLEWLKRLRKRDSTA